MDCSRRLHEPPVRHLFDSKIIAAAANIIMKKPESTSITLAVPYAKVAVDKLTEGMVLSENIYGSNGLVLAGTGVQINAKTIETIRNHTGKPNLKTTGFNIFINSIPQDTNLKGIEPIPVDLLLPPKC